MRASHFFKNEIEDNCFHGISLSKYIALFKYGEKFNVIINRENQYAVRYREEAIYKYVKDIHRIFGLSTIEELPIKLTFFDEEFEANTDQKIFDISGYNFSELKIYTNNIVGSIYYQSHYFNINCRFGNSFLQYMIANASGFLELEDLGAFDKHDLGLGEWILIYYWKLQLKKAFALGLYKKYASKRTNLTTIKGKIDINKIIRKGYFDGKTFCEYKEHSYNNTLNAVIGLALKKVFKSKYYAIVSDIYNIKNAFDALNLKSVNLDTLPKQRVANPYFQKYNQVFDLSLKILRNEFTNVGESNSKFSAFLFDISLLFEHHIRKTLKRRFRLFQKNKKEFKIPNGIFENHIFPDVVIDYGDNNIGLFDVKYKHFDKRNGINREDRFQIISYIALYTGKYTIKKSGVIYPIQAHDVSKLEEQKINIMGHLIPFQVYLYPVSNEVKEQPKLDKDFINAFTLG